LIELKKRGIIFSKADEKATKEYIATGTHARRMLLGKLYDEGFLSGLKKKLMIIERAENPNETT